MFYPEFESTYKRHLTTCIRLCENIQNANHLQQEFYTKNAYYLSGYVFECCLKYATYFYIDFSDNQTIDSLDKNSDEAQRFDVSYNDKTPFKIKHHNIQRLCEFFSSKSLPTPFDYNESAKWLNWVRRWEPDYRYQNTYSLHNFTVNQTIDYINWTEKSCNKFLIEITK